MNQSIHLIDQLIYLAGDVSAVSASMACLAHEGIEVEDTAVANAILDQLLGMIGRVLSRTANPVAVTGHLAPVDVGPDRPDPWTLSGDRAQLSRALVVAGGVLDNRISRVTGKADRHPVGDGIEDDRNRRIEITLLRRFDS